jgi:hypothetical protein
LLSIVYDGLNINLQIFSSGAMMAKNQTLGSLIVRGKVFQKGLNGIKQDNMFELWTHPHLNPNNFPKYSDVGTIWM